jgi:polyhydroxyalkanoate synthase
MRKQVMPSDSNQPSGEELSWKENLEKIDELSERLVQVLNSRKASRPELGGPDQDLYVQAASAYFSQMLSDPGKMFAQQVGQFKQSLEYLSELQNQTDDKNTDAPKSSNTPDKRFSSELWQVNPFFNMVRQQYLVSSKAAKEAVSNLEGLDKDKQKQIEFFSEQIINLFSPANFLGTNPEALTKAYETKGQSLVRGLENFIRDLEHSSGELSVTLADRQAFAVGENLATTPGSVVFQNRLFQLLQYKATTDKVHQIPLLIIPPWINKFYILDLKEKNSFIKFAVDQGFSVFVVSWVNPDASFRDVGFDTYVEDGLQEAISAVKKITAQPRINTIGYCIGGTLLSTGLAYMAAKGDKSIKSSTFFTTLVDFEDPGELSVFIDEHFLKGIEAEVDEVGYLDSSFISRAFSYLRSNDLVYGPAVKTYLMGEAPPAFDLLYWNGDSTNLPARMAKEYLRNLYQDNQLSNGTF